jgi:predicted P-loop ATPase
MTSNFQQHGVRHGASPDEWTHFDLLLGIGTDLLPVVSNKAAELSPDSKIKEVGKTPSRYNQARKVVGIAGWTGYQASDAEITRWAAEPDYGICVQTRTVRALDIDVPDGGKARAITDFVAEHLGAVLPARSRGNSGKVLLAFALPGEMAKRKMVVDGGIIEFLATGQQFVAVGTHPSGARYEWRDGLPWEFPEVALGDFEALWGALVSRFAIEPPSTGAVTARKKGARLDRPDSVADLLHEQGRVLGEDRDGALIIACPWEEEHTTGETGDGSTVWFPAGTNGHDKGHFKCLHGHCAGRSDSDFFQAVGYVEDVASDFEVVEDKGGKKRSALPPFKRDKSGHIEATIENVAMAVRRADLCGMDIRHDGFRDEIMFATKGDDWRPFRDADYSRLRIKLEQEGFKPIGRELIRDVVLMVSDENLFDTAIFWLNNLKWDGVPRVEQFLQVYFGAEDSAYVQAVSTYLWTALAGRVLVPGIKADMVPILVGEQGAAKSSSVAAMVPSPDFFTEISFNEKDDDLARKMRGRLVAEIGELRGLHTRDLESIKSFVTRTHENWVPKYREFATSFPRRLVFVGTTNQEEFLADETGNRRWLPVRTGRADIEAVKRDHAQLWAEARELFSLLGVAYQAAEELAKPVHKEHTVGDPWTEEVLKWLQEEEPLTGEKPQDRDFLLISDVAREALRLEARHVSKREEMRISNTLRECGYKRLRKRVGGKQIWIWAKTRPPETT